MKTPLPISRIKPCSAGLVLGWVTTRVWLLVTFIECLLSNFLSHLFNPLTPRVSYGDIQVILTSGSVDKILTIQMKPLQQFFHMTLFIFQYFTNEIWDSAWILILGTLGSERVKGQKSKSVAGKYVYMSYLPICFSRTYRCSKQRRKTLSAII